MIDPMLCQTVTKIGNDLDFIWEEKFDGLRGIITIQKGKIVSIQARSGVEKVHLFPDIEIDTRLDCVLDGEIGAKSGKFNHIQHRFNRKEAIPSVVRDFPAVYQCFDILEVNHHKVMDNSLGVRKSFIQRYVTESESCKIVPWVKDGIELFKVMEQSGREGVIGKNIHGLYLPGKRTPDMVKMKVLQKGIVWVVGYTEGTGKRKANYGAFILGILRPDGTWVHLGDCGSGCTDEEIDNVYRVMSTHKYSKEPFKYGTCSSKPTWVRPFQVKVTYMEISNDGKLRMPVFHGYPQTGDELVWKEL